MAGRGECAGENRAIGRRSHDNITRTLAGPYVINLTELHWFPHWNRDATHVHGFGGRMNGWDRHRQCVRRWRFFWVAIVRVNGKGVEQRPLVP